MPPKKRPKADPNQLKLKFSGQIEDVNNNRVEDACPALVEVDDDTITTLKNTKVRTFQKKCSWLRYDEGNDNVSGSDYMFCEICAENKSDNSMIKSKKNRNHRISTLNRHSELSEHQRYLKAPNSRQDMEKVCKKRFEEHDSAVTSLFKAMIWIVKEDLPLSKFGSLLHLLHDFDVNSIEILQRSKINYDSYVTASELLDSLAEVAGNSVCKNLKDSPFIAILTDESTDIANKKRQVIYAQVLNENFQPETLYICNTECHDATGAGIAQAVFREMAIRGILPCKIMSLGSDGASAMTGKDKGAAAIMRRENPHMHNVHCIAHRLALCTSQAAEGIPILKKHQQLLSDLFYYFKGSGKREARFHEIQKLVDDQILTIKEIHSVRWLSYFEALTAVYRTIDSIY